MGDREDQATTAYVVRDSAGRTGLAAVEATVFGARYAWTLPVSCQSIALFAPPPHRDGDAGGNVNVVPAGHPETATRTALALAGTAVHTVAEARR
ncbi:hypothetical protein ACHBTE_08845 [Streptomyces sp. M41]|uniref:hypothetical protein n=1 Tax=Streptomyces sp. M41 TaxID=3059412 RepID=UPI00374D4948